jgi:hypothetical protein
MKRDEPWGQRGAVARAQGRVWGRAARGGGDLQDVDGFEREASGPVVGGALYWTGFAAAVQRRFDRVSFGREGGF